MPTSGSMVQIIPLSMSDHVTLPSVGVLPATCPSCGQRGTEPIRHLVTGTRQTVSLRLCREHSRAQRLVHAGIAAAVLAGVTGLAIGASLAGLGLLLIAAAVTYLRPGVRLSRNDDGAVVVTRVSPAFRRELSRSAHPAFGHRDPLLAGWLTD